MDGEKLMLLLQGVRKDYYRQIQDKVKNGKRKKKQKPQ